MIQPLEKWTTMLPFLNIASDFANSIMIGKFHQLFGSQLPILQKMPAIVCIYDADLHIQYCNDFGLKLLGYPSDHFIGNPIADYHNANDLKSFKEAVQHCNNNNSVQLRKEWFGAKHTRIKTLCQLKKIMLEGKAYISSFELPLYDEKEPISNKKSPIPADRLEGIHKKLIHYLINEEHYLDPQVSLTKTSNTLKTPQKYLSYVINNLYHMNFNDFINYHRLVRFEIHRGQSKTAKANIDASLKIVGFGSQATFYRAKKKAHDLYKKMNHPKFFEPQK